MKNLMEKIEHAKITYTFNNSTSRYLLTVQDYCDIGNNSNDMFTVIDNSFSVALCKDTKPHSLK